MSELVPYLSNSERKTDHMPIVRIVGLAVGITAIVLSLLITTKKIDIESLGNIEAYGVLAAGVICIIIAIAVKTPSSHSDALSNIADQRPTIEELKDLPTARKFLNISEDQTKNRALIEENYSSLLAKLQERKDRARGSLGPLIERVIKKVQQAYQTIIIAI